MGFFQRDFRRKEYSSDIERMKNEGDLKGLIMAMTDPFQGHKFPDN